MRILCMLPAARGVYPPEAEERRLNLMRSYTTPATQIDVDYMPAASGFSPWGGRVGAEPPPDAAARAAQLSAQRAVQAEQEGYDAFCPFGTLDIGVREARTCVQIPVVGQAEACFLFCGLLDRPFASCSYMPGSEDRIRAWARDAGVAPLLVATTAIGIPNSEYPQRRQELLDRFVACVQEAREQGAALMGLVAMSICPTEYAARELSAASGLPVLMPWPARSPWPSGGTGLASRRAFSAAPAVRPRMAPSVRMPDVVSTVHMCTCHTRWCPGIITILQSGRSMRGSRLVFVPSLKDLMDYKVLVREVACTLSCPCKTAAIIPGHSPLRCYSRGLPHDVPRLERKMIA